MYDNHEFPVAVESDVSIGEVSVIDGTRAKVETVSVEKISLVDFIAQFGSDLLNAVRIQNPALAIKGEVNPKRDAVLNGLLRKPFPQQADAVKAVVKLLVDVKEPAGVINAEMGTGKTIMAIATAAVMQSESSAYRRTLVIAPPHLVYKWRREILQTVPDAVVWVLNGPDTLRKLIALRAALSELSKSQPQPQRPMFFILGRTRMRMGFNWVPAYTKRIVKFNGVYRRVAACACCGTSVLTTTQSTLDEHNYVPLFFENAEQALGEDQFKCTKCKQPMWRLIRPNLKAGSRAEMVKAAMIQLPTIGAKTADRLIQTFGDSTLAGMLEDNLHNFINLMNDDGDFVFSDKQARRIERALASTEVSFGQGGYQPSEYIKRYLPQDYFGLLVVDEGHEYKSGGSAQGQAMGVLARKCKKTLLLTGTLMGGYADDLFHLLFRLNPGLMVKDGFRPSADSSSFGRAETAFMRQHGVMVDIYRSSTESRTKAHRTARGRDSGVQHNVRRAPGFGPLGIMRYLLPMTVFLRLSEIGGAALPAYQEQYIGVEMDPSQEEANKRLQRVLESELRHALARGDRSLMGVVLNALLAYPDTCFRPEIVKHPHDRNRIICSAPAVFEDGVLSPKERKLIELCKSEKADGRKVLVYTTYTGTRDTASRMKKILESAGFRTSVLPKTIDSAKREDWIAEKVDAGIDVLITNPELVKTGLDLLDFPTILFAQTGFNVYTLQQAARRSWRIGQTKEVKVGFLGYRNTAQQACLTLMSKKIAVAQSTSGVMPESGLDVLNQDSGSIEMELARQLVG